MTRTPLEAELESPGYTPRRADVPRLLTALADVDDDGAKRIERALSRVGPALLDEVRARFEALPPKGRARAVSALGRTLGTPGSSDARAFVVERLRDVDALVRRRAVTALGKDAAPELEAPLLALLETGPAPPELRALVIALGNVGGEASERALGAITPGADAELARVLSEAHRKIERRALREGEGAIDVHAVPRAPVPVLLHVRAGLEEVLLSELGPDHSAKIVGTGRVAIRLSAPLSRLYAARTFLHLGFPLPEARAREGNVPAAVVQALRSEAALAVLEQFSSAGPIRYRLEWADAGKRRRATAEVAERLRAAHPRLVNDPVRAPWEAVVTERPDGAGVRVFVELWPRGISDPRFSYRRKTLPASSHPTIAAALARLASPDSGDVVWDPFVGSAMELCECALLAPGVRVVGTDRDARALDVARENLAAAGVEAPTLAVADALRYVPERAPSLVVTNPPFGRRVRGEGDVAGLLASFVEHAARVLVPGGRLVWISPRPDVTAQAMHRADLSLLERFPVDVGGIRAEVQIGERAAPRRSREKSPKNR
ncbi:MAG TPA: methyltransferase [Polyangiaceae bacterium]|nr:methyltransferase [Polyangiaceae bacterium]